MKKKIVTVALFIFTFGFLVFPPYAKASCNHRPAIGCWDYPNTTSCTVGAAQYCCNSPAECTSFQSTPALPASCVTRPAIGCWDAPNTTTCTAGVNQYCCASAGDCTNLQSGSATLPGGKQDPTAQCGGTGINTAIGCIPFTDTTDFVGHIFQFAIGIGGGIAFLLIVYSGFLIMTSTGNPERLQQGKELMTSAISGLILLIFSVFVLKLLGVNILKLPGFGS